MKTLEWIDKEHGDISGVGRVTKGSIFTITLPLIKKSEAKSHS